MAEYRYYPVFNIYSLFRLAAFMQNLMANARIVLVNTSHPGNIGGVARAMKNMGIHNLVLVDPQEFPSGKADARSAGARMFWLTREWSTP